METAYETKHCFGCGRDNPIGLKLDMKLDGDRCVAYFTPKAEHESYGDRMHGGLTSTLLDEVMGDYVFRKAGKPAYTARLEIRFRSAIRIGETVKVERENHPCRWYAGCRSEGRNDAGKVKEELLWIEQI